MGSLIGFRLGRIWAYSRHNWIALALAFFLGVGVHAAIAPTRTLFITKIESEQVGCKNLDDYRKIIAALKEGSDTDQFWDLYTKKEQREMILCEVKDGKP